MVRIEPVESGLSTNGIGDSEMRPTGRYSFIVTRLHECTRKYTTFTIFWATLQAILRISPISPTKVPPNFNVTDWEKILDADACIFTNRMSTTAL